MADPSEDDVLAIIGKGHRIFIRDTADGYLLRIERPKGAGRPLYETVSLSLEEGDALLQVVMDAFG